MLKKQAKFQNVNSNFISIFGACPFLQRNSRKFSTNLISMAMVRYLTRTFKCLSDQKCFHLRVFTLDKIKSWLSNREIACILDAGNQHSINAIIVLFIKKWHKKRPLKYFQNVSKRSVNNGLILLKI